MNGGISIGSGILWVLIWFGFMLLYTILDAAVWKKAAPTYERYLNILTIVLCAGVFLYLLTRANGFEIDFFKNISFFGILSAAASSVILYLILDKFLDPVIDKIFPSSGEKYQETLLELSKAPIVNLFQICVIAPVIEETLMRGYLLGGLSISCGSAAALLISSFLFALLHFNMAQTLSAFVCGIVLGLLYLITGSLFCCILAHMGYNLISYVTMILPLRKKK